MSDQRREKKKPITEPDKRKKAQKEATVNLSPEELRAISGGSYNPKPGPIKP
jgi:hypothetical protein